MPAADEREYVYRRYLDEVLDNNKCRRAGEQIGSRGPLPTALNGIQRCSTAPDGAG
jgi:hypothetical protein